MPLLYVLWTVALMTIIAGATQLSGTVSYQQTRNSAEAARQDAIAEAALNLAVLALLDRRDRNRLRVDGVPQTLNFDGVEISVAIRDEVGRIDLNHADAPILAGLFRAAGERAEEADKFADRILDWRDADNLARLNGAEAPAYREAGASVTPRDAPFQTVEELKNVLGMTPELFRGIEPAVTIYSGKSIVDPRVAVPLVQKALRGNIAHAAASPSSGPVHATGSLNGHAFLITIGFKIRNRHVLREAVIRLTGDPSKPYWLLSWRKRWSSPES